MAVTSPLNSWPARSTSRASSWRPSSPSCAGRAWSAASAARRAVSGWPSRPSDIALADIIRAIDGQLVGVRGERPENIGYIGVAEPLQSVWIALRANERAILEEVTLEHIATGRLPERIVELTDDPRAWA